MSSPFLITSLPDSERPRERLHEHGAQALSALELLALVIGHGNGRSALLEAGQLLAECGSLAELSVCALDRLMAVPGIGQAKSAAIAAAFELGRRSLVVQPPRITHITLPKKKQIAKIFWQQGLRPNLEHAAVALVDRRNQIQLVVLAQNSSSHVTMTIKDMVLSAFQANAQAIVLVHNHTARVLQPSQEDLINTERLVVLCRALGLPLLDHIIVNQQQQLSMADKKLIIF